MQYARLGRTGLRVSRICLGTMVFGTQTEEAAARAILDRAVAGGVTFLDTADIYPLGSRGDLVGRTEEILGRWLADRGGREGLVIATKSRGRDDDAGGDQGSSRKHIVRAVEGCLRRLGTDYLDLYQLRGPDPHTPIDETLRALEDVVRAGKVRYVGVSGFLAYEVARAVGKAEALQLPRVDCVQTRYNLVFREGERELLPYCAEEAIGVIANNPLAGGLLTGKHPPNGEALPGSRFQLPAIGEHYSRRYFAAAERETVEDLRPLAAEAGLPLAGLAVAWLLARPALTSAIVGASRPEQLDETLGAADATLDAGLLDRLDALTAPYRRGDALR
jgi:aryl-alcohol dehydrogenase (NADP+)